MELVQRDFSVSVGKFGVMTINFVAERGDETLLISMKPVKTFGGVKNITLHDFLLDA